MRPSGIPGVPEFAEDLALSHSLPRLHAHGAWLHMCVARVHPLGQFDDHVVAIGGLDGHGLLGVGDLIGVAVDGIHDFPVADSQQRLTVVEVAGVARSVATVCATPAVEESCVVHGESLPHVQLPVDRKECPSVGADHGCPSSSTQRWCEDACRIWLHLDGWGSEGHLAGRADGSPCRQGRGDPVLHLQRHRLALSKCQIDPHRHCRVWLDRGGWLAAAPSHGGLERVS